MALPTPLFFLSYARADNADLYVRKFFDQLQENIRSKLGLFQTEKIGFLDLNIPLGEKWDEDLLGALRQAPAFVPLFSPTFFRREACGREWYVIQQRLTDHQTIHGMRPRAILPVMWQTIDEAEMRQEFSEPLRYEWAFDFENPRTRPPRALLPGIVATPQAVEDLQADRTVYERQGLYGLYKRSREAAIQMIIEQLTEAIITATKSPGPLASTYRVPTLTNTHNDFEPGPMYEEKSAGVGKLHIRVAADAAPPRQQMGPYRKKGGEYWIPYTKSEDTGVKLAQDAAGEEGLQTSSDLLDGTFPTFLEQKERTNELVLVLVDPQSLAGESVPGTPPSCFSDYLRSLDKAGINTIVIIPWDQEVGYSGSEQRRMQVMVKKVLPNRLARKDELLLHAVENHVAFKEGLKKCLLKAIMMTVARSEMLAPPSTTYAIPLPNPR